MTDPLIVEFFAHLPTIVWLSVLHYGMRHFIPSWEPTD